MRREHNNPHLRKIRSEIRKRHPEHIGLMVKKRAESMKENPEKWQQLFRKREDDPEIRELRSKMGISSHRKHPELSALNARKVLEILRKRKNIIWKGAHFSSWEEREIAKLLCPNPKEGFNVQVPNGSFTADFFPEQKVFVEYHPNLYNKVKHRIETRSEYMAPRIKEAKKKGFRIEFIWDRVKHDLNRKSYNPKVLALIGKIKKEYELA